jgi:hypothetical protein
VLNKLPTISFSSTRSNTAGNSFATLYPILIVSWAKACFPFKSVRSRDILNLVLVLPPSFRHFAVFERKERNTHIYFGDYMEAYKTVLCACAVVNAQIFIIQLTDGGSWMS